MDIWAKQGNVDLNSVVITLVGDMKTFNITVGGTLIVGPDGHFTFRDQFSDAWEDDQVSPFDWLRDALVAYAERL